MNDRTLVGPWIRRFLLEHLVAERNLARNTQASYRDTLTLLLPFAKERTKIPIDRLAIEDLSSDIIIQFLKRGGPTKRDSFRGSDKWSSAGYAAAASGNERK